jgi:hypothetical protein
MRVWKIWVHANLSYSLLMPINITYAKIILEKHIGGMGYDKSKFYITQ